MAEIRDTAVSITSTASSNITDYFKATKSPVKETKASKARLLNTSSVYLTPESSPSKDQIESSTGDNGADGQVLKSTTTKSPLAKALHISSTYDHVMQDRKGDEVNSNDFSDDGKSDGEHQISEVVADSIATLDDETDKADANGCIFDDGVHIEELERPVLSHSPICNGYGTRSKNVEKKKPSVNSSEASGAVSSPCLPRPKVRKGAPLKKDATSSDAHATESPQMKPKPGRRKKKEPAPVQSSTITDFFPVRRSGRQTKREIEQQKLQLVEKLISSNCEDGLEVKNFDGKGRGIVAGKQFDKGDFVVEYAGDLIDPTAAKEREDKYSQNPDIGCYMYYFVHGDKQYCVDATLESGRLGRLINHSRDGNCCTKVVSFRDGPRLILVALRNIEAGEELSYDYGDRRKSSIEAHPWLKL